MGDKTKAEEGCVPPQFLSHDDQFSLVEARKLGDDQFSLVEPGKLGDDQFSLVDAGKLGDDQFSLVEARKLNDDHFSLAEAHKLDQFSLVEARKLDEDHHLELQYYEEKHLLFQNGEAYVIQVTVQCTPSTIFQ